MKPQNIFRKFLLHLAFLLIGFFLIIPASFHPAYSATGILEQMNFQGKLLNTSGTNVANGDYNIEFKIYQDGNGVPGGGDETLKWTETREGANKVTVTDGVFRVRLGSVTAFGSSVDWNQDTLWLSINIGGTGSPSYDGEMNPMVRLTAAPYALNAKRVAGLTVTDTTGTFTLANAKTLTVSNTLTFAGTDSTTITFQGTDTYVGRGTTDTLTNKTIGSTGLIFSGASTDIDTAASEGLTLQGRAASILSTTAGNITLEAAGTGTIATVQIGAGGSGSTTPDFFGLDVKSDTGDPAGGFEGAMYYNTSDNKFRCFQGAAWADCIGSGVGGAALDTLTAATTDDAAILSGDNTIIWEWALTSATSRGITIGESAASTGGSGNQFLLELTTDADSTAGPLSVISNSADAGDIEFDLNSAGDFVIMDAGTAFATFDDTGGINFTLPDTATDSKFDINIAADNHVNITRLNNTSSETPTHLLKLENLSDDNAIIPDALKIVGNDNGIGSPNITDAIDVSGGFIVNAINIGANKILGTTGVIDFTFFDVSSSGDIETLGNTILGNAATDTIRFTASLNSHVNFLDANAGVDYTINGSDATGSGNAGGDITINAGSGLGAGNGGDLILSPGSGGSSGTGGTLILKGGPAGSGTYGYITLNTQGSERLRIAVDGTFLFEKGTNDLTLSVTAPSGGSRILTIPALGADGNLAAYGGSLAGGDLLYGATTNVLTRLTIGGGGTCLTSNGSAPSWGSCGGAAALDTLTAATTDDAAILSGDNTIIWEWALTSATSRGMTIGESAASTGGSGNQFLLELTTDTGSTAGPLSVISNSADAGDIEFNLNNDGDFTIQDVGVDILTIDDTGAYSYVLDGVDDPTYTITNNGLSDITTALAGGGNMVFDMTSTGDFYIRAAGNIAVFNSSGGIQFQPSGTSDLTLSLDDDSSAISTGTVTNTGFLHDINLTLGNDTAVDTVSAVNIDVTSASTGDADILYGLNIGNLTSADATVSETGLRIGTDWDTAIEANGNVVIGARSDSTAGSYSLTNSAAGTFDTESSITGVTASAIFKGKLFVATSKTDAAGVYRYDGGTTWTLVTGGTVGPTSPGKVLTGDAANIDSFSLSVFNNKLVIGTRGGANVAGVYTSTNADTGTAATTTWTLLNTTRGTFATGCTNACSTVIDGVDDIAVYNGQLYIITQETNLMEVYRYNGGTGASVFVKISDIAGEILTADATDGDGGVFAVYGERLYVGIKTGSTTGRVFYYDGAVADQTSAGTWVLVNTTRGTFTAGTTGEPDVTSMTVFNGSLWLSTAKANAANIYKLKGGPAAPAGASPFQKITATNGKIISGDTANIDSIILRGYQGRLYVGTSTGAATNTGAVYEYDTSLAAADNFSLIGTRGTFGSQTNIDDVTALQPMNISGNGALFYVGTNDSGNVGSVYSWFKYLSQSNALRLDSGSSNLGSIIFTADDQAFDNNGRLGKFVFSHSVNLSSGAFDYAEDYPTYDSTLEPGDIVSVDPTNKEFVKRANAGDSPLGIYSESPGFRLQQSEEKMNGEKWIPIALVGRVPVKVTTENGKIEPGDYLTLSSTVPGAAMKATKAGAVVGQALEAYSDEGVGKLTVYVATGSFNGAKLASLPGLDSYINQNGVAATNQDISRSTLAYLKDHTPATVSSEIFTDQVTAGLEIITPKVTTDKVALNIIEAASGSDIGLKLKEDGRFVVTNLDGEETITFDAKGNAHFAGTLTADKVRANQIEGLEIYTDKIEKLSKTVDTLSQEKAATDEASLTENTSEETGLNLEILGDLLAHGGLIVEKDAIFKGETVFEKLVTLLSNVIFRGEVSFEKVPVFAKDTAGFAKIYRGQRYVEVAFDEEYRYEPIVNITINQSQFDQSAFEKAITEGDCILPISKEDCQAKLQNELFDESINYLVTQKTKKGFIILLSRNAKQEIVFSWTALTVKDPKTSERASGDGIKTITPTPIPQTTETPTPTPTPQHEAVLISPTPTPQSSE